MTDATAAGGRVAGFGFRSSAGVASLRAALAAAGGAEGVTALATLAAKAGAPGLVALGRETGLPVLAIPAEDLARQPVLTLSPQVAALHGTGSVAEAAAMAGAGAGARLLGPRVASKDGMATAAIAVAGQADGPEGAA